VTKHAQSILVPVGYDAALSRGEAALVALQGLTAGPIVDSDGHLRAETTGHLLTYGLEVSIELHRTTETATRAEITAETGTFQLYDWGACGRCVGKIARSMLEDRVGHSHSADLRLNSPRAKRYRDGSVGYRVTVRNHGSGPALHIRVWLADPNGVPISTIAPTRPGLPEIAAYLSSDATVPLEVYPLPEHRETPDLLETGHWCIEWRDAGELDAAG